MTSLCIFIERVTNMWEEGSISCKTMTETESRTASFENDPRICRHPVSSFVNSPVGFAEAHAKRN